MSPLSIDTEATRRIGDALVAEGDQLRAAAAALRADAERLHLGQAGLTARLAIERAAERAWSSGVLLHVASDAAERADVVDTGIDPLSGMAEIADGLIVPSTIATLVDDLVGWSPPRGDPGGTGSTESRSPYTGFGSDPLERGRNLVARALADTGDGDQLRPDEFGVVSLRGDRFVVVLPGVIDLSDPDLFFDDRHRSVRDLDQVAARSAWSSSVGDNRYAEMVWSSLAAAGVPTGSSLLLVGHSFGADTAIDLAADPAFNGEQYRVTHVVAAGYHVDAHVPDVDESTRVLVLQNRRDLPVIGEGLLRSHLADAIATVHLGPAPAIAAAIGSRGHSGRGVGALVQWARDAATVPLAASAEIAGWTLDRTERFAELAIAAGGDDPAATLGAAGDLLTLPTGVRLVGANAVIDVFDGGSEGWGHHQSNYVEHVASTTHPAVTRFLASLDAAGYASAGGAVAIDVSVPRSRR